MSLTTSLGETLTDDNHSPEANMSKSDSFNNEQPLSPIISIGKVTHTSTPITTISDTNMVTETQVSTETPVKHVGHLYYCHQRSTPVMSSPSWSNLVQSSPCIQTPSSSGSRTRHMPRLRTPSSNQSNKKGSPQMHTPDQPYNPFDSNLLERLNGSVFSPNVFAEVKSAQQTPKSFQWTIDELAILKPANIDELPNQPDAISTQTDLELEKRAQEVIDAYFANNLIAPSPWSENSSKNNFVLPETPKTPASLNSSDVPLTFGDREVPSTRNKKCSMSDVGCQTMLTLPVNFNIEKVLGEHFMYKDRNSEELGSQEILSMSSLRRKLFFHGDQGVPPSPVRSSECMNGKPMDYDASPMISPLKHVHETPKRSCYISAEMPTPGSAQFSSSPISLSHCGNALTPFMRRCSTAPDLIESPGFSPIVSTNSPHCKSSPTVTPVCHQFQTTPASSQAVRPLESPTISPIVQHEDRFILKRNTKLKKSRSRIFSEKIRIPPELRPESENAADDSSSEDMDLGVNHSPHHSADDLSFLSSEDHFRKAHIYGSSRLPYSDDEASNQDGCQTYYVSQASQDTGYNTNSLQLTNNQETGLQSMMSGQNETSLHTNITQQFGSLPFSSQDSLFSDGSCAAFSQKPTRKVFVRHLAPKSAKNDQKISASDSVDDEVLNEREVRHRAKRILGRSISMDESELSGCALDFSRVQPCLLNTIGLPVFDVLSQNSSYRTKYTVDDKILPSELASHVLRKAGEDLRKYCDEDMKENHAKHREAGGGDLHHFQTDSDNHTTFNISMSAEF